MGAFLLFWKEFLNRIIGFIVDITMSLLELANLYKHATKTSIYTPVLIFAYAVIEHNNILLLWALLIISIFIAAQIMLIEHKYIGFQQVTLEQITSDVKQMPKEKKMDNFFFAIIYVFLFISSLLIIIQELQSHFNWLALVLFIIALLGLTFRVLYFFEHKEAILEQFKQVI